MSCGNGGPWKEWKAKSRLPTLSTVLGKPAKAAGFPHSHSFDNWSLYKEELSKAGLTAEPKTVTSEGGPKQTAEVAQNQLPNASSDEALFLPGRKAISMIEIHRAVPYPPKITYHGL
jgi:hypothetical protein